MLNFVQQAFFLLSTEGSLVITRAYQPYTFVGPPVRELVLDPLAVYSSRTVYICGYVDFILVKFATSLLTFHAVEKMLCLSHMIIP